MPSGDVPGEPRPGHAPISHPRHRAAGAAAGQPIRGAVLGVIGGLIVFVAAVLALVLLDDPDGRSAQTAEREAAAGAPDETADVGGEAEATPDVLPEITAGQPTNADAARFLATLATDGDGLESVTADLSGDGVNEVVLVAVVHGGLRLEVATWAGERYEIAFSDHVGPADTIDDLIVADVTADGHREIVTAQSGDGRASVAIWAWDGGEIVRRAARGGCWDGTHVYGTAGASVADGALEATCEAVPDVVAPGTVHTYLWDGEAWTYDPSEEDA